MWEEAHNLVIVCYMYISCNTSVKVIDLAI